MAFRPRSGMAWIRDSASDPPSAEEIGHLGPGAMEPGLDGADRPPEGRADLLVGEPLFVEQAEDGAIFRPELIDGPPEFPGEVVRIGQTGTRIDGFFVRDAQGGTPGAAREGGPAAVGGDAEQPGAQRPLPV